MGYPWAHDDRLTAADLNAAIGAAAVGQLPAAIGTGIGQIPRFINYQGSGLPGLLGSSRMIFRRATASGTDAIDFQFARDTTGVTVTGFPLMTALRMGQVVGANDGANNWAFLSTITTNGTSGGNSVGGYLQGVRASTGTDKFWGAVIECRDQNHNPTVGIPGSQVSVEVDLFANNVDTAVNLATWGGVGNRKGINIVVQQDDKTDTNPATFTNALWISGDNNKAIIESAIGFATTTVVYSALDCRGLSSGNSNPVNAVTMQAGHVIDFNGGPALDSAPGNYFAYDSGSSRLKYYIGGVAKFSIDASGNMRCAGTVTGSTTP